jgi:hypothetical protein
VNTESTTTVIATSLLSLLFFASALTSISICALSHERLAGV